MLTGDTVTQIDGLWFSNDTVILRAGNSVFRVCKSILAARSSVFQSMFEFPQPASDGDEIMDGSPVVRLHDSAADVEPFIRAIFDSSYFMPPPERVDGHAALGILRLSHKYDVGYLHRRALRHLETVYPIERARYTDFWPKSLLPVGNSTEITNFDLKAIPIFQEVGASWLLPCAFYNAGSVPPMLEIGAAWDRLPMDAKKTCLVMNTRLLRCVMKVNRFIGNASTCATAETCNAHRFGELLRSRVTHRNDLVMGGGQEPLAEWEEGDWDALGEIFCEECLSEARAEHAAAEAEVWDELPVICGLQSWDVLKEARRVALGE
ncbi:hypothetical protein B0H15DRAFT_957434 [Mycena belliarum]|uniref:BTB domain-containing protein n=1 Tax=Mycena belliarum TaxID=1033014 RepID=A0AAD6TSP6_9AGAR|nr:hypothetical protein B0H15DRAFT_957434 [Mycena belliae]